MLVMVCWDSGKFTFHISLTWKTLFSTSDNSMYPFKSAFSVSAMKKKIDEDALDTISMDSEVRGKTWTFREESRRRRSLVCLASEEKMRKGNSQLTWWKTVFHTLGRNIWGNVEDKMRKENSWVTRWKLFFRIQGFSNFPVISNSFLYPL